jgi:DNA-binding transcriptional regulator YhcF (GntR family)
MQLWFSRTSGISIREQLATQVVLGIVSGELAAGQRLPSTRELARRFHLHPNTVSAGYRQLERGNWVEFRRGSGIYVGKRTPTPPPNGIALDRLIADFFRSTRELNTPLSEVRSRLRHWLELQPPDHFLLIEPDEQLAKIIVAEMREVVGFPVWSCVPADYRAQAEGAVPVAISFSEKTFRASLPAGLDVLTLHLRSAGASLAAHLPASRTALVGIASGWAPFLKNARTMLIAAGFDPECLVLRDPAKPGWMRGLKETAAVVCDSLTAQELRGFGRVLSFPLVADSSLRELRNYEQFLRSPLVP